MPHYYYDSNTSKYPTANGKEYVNSYHGRSHEYAETSKFFGKALKTGNNSLETDFQHYQHKYTAGVYPTEDKKGLVNPYHGSFEDQTDEKARKPGHISWGNDMPRYYYDSGTSMGPTAKSKEYMNSYHGSSEYVETQKLIGKALKPGLISWGDDARDYYYDTNASMYPNANSTEYEKSYHGSSDEYVKSPKLIANSYHGGSEDHMKGRLTEKALEQAQISTGNNRIPAMKGRIHMYLGSYEEGYAY